MEKTAAQPPESDI